MFRYGCDYYVQGIEVWDRVEKEVIGIARDNEEAVWWAAKFNSENYSAERAKRIMKKKK